MEKLNLHGSTELDCSAIMVGQTVTANCLCLSAEVRQTQGEKRPFIRFILKDVHGNSIVARAFEVDVAGIGFIASTYKNVAMRITAEVSSFNGRLTLVLDSLADVDVLDNTAINRAKFLGMIQPLDRMRLLSAFEEAGCAYQPQFDTTSLLSVFDGRVGGFARLLECALLRLKALDGLPGFEPEKAARVLTCVSWTYFKFLSLKQESPILVNYQVLDLMSALSLSTVDAPDRALILDAAMSLLEIRSAEQLHAILVVNTLKDVLHSFDLLSTKLTMLPGTKVPVGGDVLLNG